MNKRIMIGISGGVDSAAGAYLLKEQGYEVVGLTLRLNGKATDTTSARNCAEALGIEFHEYDYSGVFAKNIKGGFAESYMSGETPNPCVMCNRLIKFGSMMKIAKEMGCDRLATGHYANIEYDGDRDRYILKKGADENKDQSYFLWNLTQDQLSRIEFPLSNMSKPEIRKIAEEAQLPCAHSAESQDVCFIPDGDYVSFIEKFTGRKFPAGDFVDLNGNILGRHRGIIAYTVGQRRGLGVSADRPLYVIGKNIAENTVILGDDSDLYKDVVRVRDLNLIGLSELTEPLRVEAKIRYSTQTSPALLTPHDGGAVLEFDMPQRGPAPGQSAVFYNGDTVLGGGIITR